MVYSKILWHFYQVKYYFYYRYAMNFLKILDFELFIYVKNWNLKLIILDNYLQYLLKRYNQNNYLQWFCLKYFIRKIMTNCLIEENTLTLDQAGKNRFLPSDLVKVCKSNKNAD